MAVIPLNPELLAALLDHFPQGVTVTEAKDPVLLAEPGQLLALAEFLKNAPEYRLDFLSNLTAVDYPEYIEMVYHLNSLALAHKVTLKVRIAKTGTELPSAASVASLWPTAEFQEREVYDLIGVAFTGHPDLRRILLPDDFSGHPLRKDYKLPSRAAGGDATC